MKISICDGKKRFVIRLPLSFLKSKFVCNALKKSTASKYSSHEENVVQDVEEKQRLTDTATHEPSDKQEFVPTPAFMKEICSVLRYCVKETGHFVLLDVQSGDGEKVKITV